MNPQRQRFRRADDGIDAEPHRIEPQQRLLMHAASAGQKDQHRHHRAHDHIAGIKHPEDRRIDQQVAQGSPAHACNGGEEDERDHVLPLLRGHKGAGRRESRDACIIQN